MMTAVPKLHKLSAAEYLALEKKAQGRSEFFDGEMFAMTGASREHNIITRNLVGNLYSQMLGSSCEVFVADQRVKVDPTGLYTYADVIIVCGSPEYALENRDTLINPKVVIEVLSPTTERYDRTTKFRHYQQILSLTEYILVAQDEALVERYVRQLDSSWVREDFVGLDASLTFVAVPAVITLSDIYRRVEFPTRPAVGPMPIV